MILIPVQERNGLGLPRTQKYRLPESSIDGVELPDSFQFGGIGRSLCDRLVRLQTSAQVLSPTIPINYALIYA